MFSFVVTRAVPWRVLKSEWGMNIFAGELLGTGLLLLLGNGVVANVVLRDTKGHGGGWIVIAFGWAMAVYTGVVVAQDSSGAHLNPAVTFGLALQGSIAWSMVPLYIGAQFLGAAIGTTFVWLIYHDHYSASDDQGAKRATFCTTPAIRNIPKNLLSEVMGTFVLLAAVFSFSGPNWVSADDVPAGLGSLGALPVALIVLAIGLSLGGATGYAINPARDLAPRVMHSMLPVSGKGGSDWAYAWVPVVGPLLGAALTVLVFLLW